MPFSSANFFANGEISILSFEILIIETGFNCSFATGAGSSFTTGAGSSFTTGAGSSFTIGAGSSFTIGVSLLTISEISSPLEPIIAIILSTGAVDPSSIPM